jgi:hypothetical protein
MEIEALADSTRDLIDGGRPLEVLHFPVRFGKEWPWIAGPVIGGKRYGE